MLIKEQLKEVSFTPAEQLVVAFLEEKQEQIQDYTLRNAAKECFTYPSTFVRVAKKMGFSGWEELKKAYLAECDYLGKSVKAINANIPFTPNDSLMTVAGKIKQLTMETTNDTFSLLTHDQLAKAIQLLIEADEIRIFARNHNILIAHEFCLRMNRIGHACFNNTVDGEQLFDAANAKTNSCALFISYSGESSQLRKAMTILKKKKVPMILITSIGNNSMAQLADCILEVTTREKLYSKIGNFTVSSSIKFLLDVLYAGCFAQNYQKNYEHLVEISLQADGRTSQVGILKENE